MEEAHRHYITKLSYDNSHTPLDRLIYLNDRELNLSLIEEDVAALAKTILIRFYYYIFEYNRVNGISIHGNNFLMPGEFTEYWEIFSDNQSAIRPEELKKLFSQQLMSFIGQDGEKSAHVNRVMKLLEFIRVTYQENTDVQSWSLSNTIVYDKSIDIIEQSIKRNLNFSPDYVEPSHNQWYMTMNQQIIFDKECIILLDYIKEMQNTFNKYAEIFFSNEVNFQVVNQAQRLAMAKVAAMKNITFGHISPDTTQETIIEYDRQLQHGNLDILIKTAAFWYLDFLPDSSQYLASLNVMDVLKEFHHYDLLNFEDYNMRAKENYSSVLDVLPYEKINDGDLYFYQFQEYRYHDMYCEARNITRNLISHANFDYFDIIFPPKELYTFKIYSRKYVQNTLSDDNWVFFPADNIGYLSIVKTQNNRLDIMSTLLNVPFAKVLDLDILNYFIQRIIYEWKKTRFNLSIKSRHHIGASVSEICSLFCDGLSAEGDAVDFLRMLLIQPEENKYSNPTSAYTLIADKPEKTFTSLLEAMDYWNEKTLGDTALVLSESLKKADWLAVFTSQIPFYDIVWQYWYNPDFSVQFKDVFFDIFDITLAIGSAGLSIQKFTRAGLIEILVQAKHAKIPSQSLKQYVLGKIFISTPGVMLKATAKISEVLINNINPLPFYNVIHNEIGHFFISRASRKIDWLKDYAADYLKKKNTRLKAWASEVSRAQLILREEGIFSESAMNIASRNFISIENNFYEIICDSSMSRWRITNATESNGYNYAIPVDKNKNNVWVSAKFIDKDPIFSLNELELNTESVYSQLNEIKFEPIKPHANAVIAPQNDENYILRNLMSYMIYLKPRISVLSPDLKDDIAIIKALVEYLTDVEKLHQELVGSKDDETKQHLLLFNSDIIKSQNYHFIFRLVYFWNDEYDRHAFTHIVLNVIIGMSSYIIDFNPALMDLDRTSPDKWVFLENAWLLYYKTNKNTDSYLVKYKDFDKIEKVEKAFNSDSLSSGKYVEGTFILKESWWYKSAVVKYIARHKNKKITIDMTEKLSILDIARRMTSRRREFAVDDNPLTVKIDFPFRLLRESRLITNENFERMINLVWWAVRSPVPFGSYMSTSMPIQDFADLLRIGTGNLLAIVADDGFLLNLLISVGDGRFVGAENEFFNIHLPSTPSIIVAEEMGTIVLGKFYPWTGVKHYNLFAGTPDGVAKPLPILTENIIDLESAKIINQQPALAKADDAKKREKILLGNQWSLLPLKNAKDRLDIVMHVTGFGNDDMDIDEFTHIVRALTHINPNVPVLSELKFIEYVSCFEGFETTNSTGQYMADKLQVTVEYYPYIGGEGIRQRRPQWFAIFTPNKEITVNHSDLYYEVDKISKDAEKRLKRSRFIDLLKTLLSLKHSIGPRAKKRASRHLPYVYINIAQYILGDIKYSDFVEHHALSKSSAEMLRTVKSDYDFTENNSNDIYIQCYLDILYSIAEFKHLLKWVTSSERLSRQIP
ncbi:hypothetical protein [Acerihabitans arboris]|uniref:Uncharacterized protein n=1 Tax=Acerihabitans arboris TaxID=2691583 RepID=A0A845SNM6_9GAMM|nr:hypothetical protein [Acerihabitans arboris]NDL62815.1 hypothetical protein [Acerihabitans arboris]